VDAHVCETLAQNVHLTLTANTENIDRDSVHSLQSKPTVAKQTTLTSKLAGHVELSCINVLCVCLYKGMFLADRQALPQDIYGTSRATAWTVQST
jgi:hypothetical protein